MKVKNLKIITDGAYSSLRDQGGIGIIFLLNDQQIFEYSKMYKHVTNNKMELAAVIVALRMLKKEVDSITVITDSQYVIGCATLGWQRKKNKRLWEEFDKQYKRVSELCPKIEFKHVKGHSGSYWNERADKLAVSASTLEEIGDRNSENSNGGVN